MDAISRQAAIDAVKEFRHGAAEWREEQEEDSNIWHRADSALASAIEIGLRIKAIPSAQPEPCEDAVNRADVVDMLEMFPFVEYSEYEAAREVVKRLPSAQPEPLTDAEQRIFLAAMGREEKVCEEADRNYVREPYEANLMSICREIRRKVKGALWT